MAASPAQPDSHRHFLLGCIVDGIYPTQAGTISSIHTRVQLWPTSRSTGHIHNCSFSHSSTCSARPIRVSRIPHDPGPLDIASPAHYSDRVPRFGAGSGGFHPHFAPQLPSITSPTSFFPPFSQYYPDTPEICVSRLRRASRPTCVIADIHRTTTRKHPTLVVWPSYNFLPTRPGACKQERHT